MLSFSLTLVLFASYYQLTYAGSVNSGGNCSLEQSKLQPGTYEFWSNCDSVTYCNEQGICTPKGCRKDQFPFGYAVGATLPPQCSSTQFCPDEGSGCLDLLAVGSPCQLNRDDQCEPPPNFQDLADTTGQGLNFNGSVCLDNVCMWANATLGSSCVVENVPYVAYGVSGEFINIVSRHNCQSGLYCDSTQLTCMTSKNLNAACTADKECLSLNCLSSGFCGTSAASPLQFGTWVYALVALGIVGGMSGTLTGLYITHRKQREEERARRAQYWREQNAFHQNLMHMRETARESILSLPNTPAARDSFPRSSSGLRYMTSSDTSEFGRF